MLEYILYFKFLYNLISKEYISVLTVLHFCLKRIKQNKKKTILVIHTTLCLILRRYSLFVV